MRFKKLTWLLLIALAFPVIAALTLWFPANRARHALEATRQELRREGFKTDLSEFDLSAGTESKSWESILRKAMENPAIRSSRLQHPDLLPAAGSDLAIAIWKHEWLADAPEEIGWPEFNAMVRQNQTDVDAAACAVISGTAHFPLDSRRGMSMTLPHLPMLKGLAQTLGSRTILELHDGDTAAAWTNLLAQTRLVTADRPAPIDVAHLVRFACLTIAFNCTWQALQTNAWSEAQLALLQSEWEKLDLFKDLPETAAFRRVGTVVACEELSKEPFELHLGECFKEFARSPRSGWASFAATWREFQYRIHGIWRDQTALLIYFRDREIEMRNAIRAASWREMQSMPGVTNAPFFKSASRASRIQAMLNVRELGAAVYRGATPFLGRASEAEARRRILIAALALERYRLQKGNYPDSLQALTPRWIDAPLMDFITGEPLRYQRGNDGRFVLYSAGIDGIDNGGAMRQWTRNDRVAGLMPEIVVARNVDIVWPRPATTDEVAAYESRLAAEATEEFVSDAKRASDYFWRIQLNRQLNAERSPGAQQVRAESFSVSGTPVETLLQKGANSGGTNTLADLLTLRPVPTGREPEILAFELPIQHATLLTVGTIRLVVDAAESSDEFDAPPAQATCESGPDGLVRLTWNTIFDTPGRHTVQALLEVEAAPPAFEPLSAAGPPLAVVCNHLCQFGMASTSFDTNHGAPLHMRFAEPHANYTLEILTTNKERLRTFTGTVSNGTELLHWNLVDDAGRRWNGDFFESRLHVTLPGSGRSRTMTGP